METIGLACLYGLTAMDDLKTKQVRVIEIIVFGIIGILTNIIYRPHTLLSVLGGVGIGLLTILFSYISKEKIGMGDAYIITVTGLYLGFINTAVLLWISSLLAAITGLVLIRKYDNPKMEIPFVPFLLMAYIIMYLIHIVGGIVR